MRDINGCSIVEISHFSKPSKDELELQQKLIKEFLAKGGKVKDYSTNIDKDNYKLKGIKHAD
jgi:hypothetical protein